MTESDCILDKSFQYSSENEPNGGDTAGRDMSQEATVVILVIRTPAPQAVEVARG